MAAVADIRGDGLTCGVSAERADRVVREPGVALALPVGGRVAVQVTIPQLTASPRGLWPAWCGTKISTTPTAAARQAPVPIPTYHRRWASEPSHRALVTRRPPPVPGSDANVASARVAIDAKRDPWCPRRWLATAAVTRTAGYQPTA